MSAWTIVTRSLKKHSRSPTFICDANGTLRYVRTVLAGYIADMPEKTHDCRCAAESITRLPSIVGPIRRRPSPRSSQRCSYLLAAAGFGEGGVVPESVGTVGTMIYYSCCRNSALLRFSARSFEQRVPQVFVM